MFKITLEKLRRMLLDFYVAEQVSDHHRYSSHPKPYPDIIQSKLIRVQFSSFLFVLLLASNLVLVLFSAFFHRGLQPIKFSLFPDILLLLNERPILL